MPSSRLVRLRRRCAVAALFVAACSPAPPVLDSPQPVPEPLAAPDAVEPSHAAELRDALDSAAAGIEDPQLAALLRDHWQWSLQDAPIFATRLGVHQFDDRLPQRGADAIAARRAKRRELLARADALPPLSAASDRVSKELLAAQLRAAQASEICDFHLWSLSPRDNPVTEWNHLPEVQPLKTAGDGERLLARYRAIAAAIDTDTANLRSGASQGLRANAESTKRVVAMVQKQLAQPIAQWPLLAPARKPPSSWEQPMQQRFAVQLNRIVEQQIRPALQRYLTLLEELLPHARDQAHGGVGALPKGAACYRARILANTTLTLEPQQIHDLGKREIARIDEEIRILGKRALSSDGLAATLAALRDDPKLRFQNEAEVETAARQTLREAKSKMSQWFGRLPKSDCVVRRVPSYEAPYTTIAYYRPPHADGSKPGEYFVNVFEPHKRPRYEARVLAVHEAIPGHHLQIAIAQELGAIPAFRKHGHITAYVEGWALYTERLADEMGMYRNDLDRMGMLSFDAWRAARLVVDSGVHALGWTRQQAKDYLREHTALSLDNIDNEVDRYLSWPGQALGYKLGQLEILKLRRYAEEQLGDRFRLADFHDVLLQQGALSLTLLRDAVEAHVRERADQAAN